MSRRVKEFVDITDQLPLGQLIEKLVEIQDSLPEGCEAELRLRGDEIFGHRITITYLRDQTAEEAACEKRYAEAEKAAKARELERLQQELGVVCYAAPGKRSKAAAAPRPIRPCTQRSRAFVRRITRATTARPR